MTERKGSVPITLTPLTFGAETQTAQRILADLRSVATEIYNIGIDMSVVEIALNATITIEAVEQIFAGQVVTATGDLADSDLVAQVGRVLGVALNNAAPGQAVTVIRYGIAPRNGGASGDVLWLRDNGTLSNNPPTTGFQQKIGIGISSAAMLVSLGDPIVLA